MNKINNFINQQLVCSFSKMNKILYPLLGLTLILLMLYNFNIITNIIEVIVNTISNIITNIIQLLKSEFIPSTILFDDGNVIQVSDPIIHISVQDLYKIKNYYCGVNLYDDLNIAIDPSNIKGIQTFKQVHSLYLSDT
jgi:hypothetical protein